MRCEDVRPLLSAGMDGELDASRASQVEAHVRACALCGAERQALFATVGLLRALPEADPPTELRRRIGVALLDAQRSAERRWFLSPWLARPKVAGWAWGAAAGAVIAVVGLGVTHRSVSTPPMAVRQAAPAATASVATPQPRSVVAALPAVSKPAPSPVQGPKAAPADGLPGVVAAPDAPATTLDVAIQPDPPKVKPSGPKASGPAGRSQRPIVTAKRSAPTASLARHTTPSVAPRVASMPNRLELTGPEASGPGRNDPMPDTAAPSLPTPRDESMLDTVGMTQMASSDPAIDPPTVSSDDLVALRRRLIERPLQVPELGALRPTDGPRGSREGWIRF